MEEPFGEKGQKQPRIQGCSYLPRRNFNFAATSQPHANKKKAQGRAASDAYGASERLAY